uniref:VWFA domain-containing protein n=1 Tax=Caenorhabditis japonica TaxID=281687 RepID=A0A8R1I5S7_CAEJA
MLLPSLLLSLLVTTSLQQTASPPAAYDRSCGKSIANLWLDVVVVVDNSVGMTQSGIIQVAAQIVSVFGDGTRIGTNYADKRTTRVGIVTYNKIATIQADLNRFQSENDLFSTTFSILSSTSTSDEVYLAKGIGAAEQVLSEGRKNNTRTNYKQFVIIYASDYRDDGAEDPRPIADRLKASGVNIATVAFDQDGDESILKDLGEIASPGMNFSNTDNDNIGELQTAMFQTNCFCPNMWHQYRENFDDENAPKFGVCLRPVAITAAWSPAKFACQNMVKTGYLVAEFNQNKHDFVFNLVKNDTSFPEPYVYHIGLSFVNGGYYWQQPAGHALKPLSDGIWNPGFPQQATVNTAVLNQQEGTAFTVGWQNINQFTVSERYVCEVPACDTDNYCE